MALLCRLQSQLDWIPTTSKMSSSGPTSILPKYWRMLVSNSHSSSRNRIHCCTPTTPSPFISTTFSNNSCCNSNRNFFCSSDSNPLRHPCSIHPNQGFRLRCRNVFLPLFMPPPSWSNSNSAGSLNLEHLVGPIQKTMGMKTGMNRTKRRKSSSPRTGLKYRRR